MLYSQVKAPDIHWIGAWLGMKDQFGSSGLKRNILALLEIKTCFHIFPAFVPVTTLTELS
jgi:hypothetical protein